MDSLFMHVSIYFFFKWKPRSRGQNNTCVKEAFEVQSSETAIFFFLSFFFFFQNPKIFSRGEYNPHRSQGGTARISMQKNICCEASLA